MESYTTESISEQLRRDIALITSTEENEIDCSASLASIGIDSLSLVEIFIAVERRFNLKLLDAGLCNDDLRSIDSLSSKICQLIQGGSSETKTA